MEDLFYKWLYIRRKQRAIRLKKKASIFYTQSLLYRGLKRFKHYPTHSRLLLKKERIKRRVSSYYNQGLLRKIFQKLKEFTQLAIKSKLLENEHQLRRNKIQNFITNFKSSKEPSTQIPKIFSDLGSVTPPPVSLLSRSEDQDFAPPSYRSTTLSPQDPSPLKPLNIVPQPQPTGHRPRSALKSGHTQSSSQSQAIRSIRNPTREVTQPTADLPPGKDALKQKMSRPLSANRTLSLNRDRSKDSKPPENISHTSTCSESTTRTTRSQSTSNGRPIPRNTSSNTNSDDQLSKPDRRDKMRQLEEAAKARVQTKKQRDDEAKRKKELEEEEKYRQEIEAIRSQYANQRKFSNSSVKNPTREIQIETEKKLIQKALSFYRTNLLINFGFAPWNRLVQERRDDWEKAVRYYEDCLLSQSWQSFVSYVLNIRKERYRLEARQSTAAITFYKRKLIRIVWMKWKSYRKILRAKAIAVQGQILKFGRFKRAFRAWQFSLERIRRRQTSVQTAMVHQANLALLRRCVHRWRQYINEQEFEREIESKVDLTWAKVQDWLI